ncbi:hypothetical protein BD626DRAFT_564000 [Schizophyllum amplum]|uniref:Uncharacterized protein n=1 Tax=Schizophyllum amplum TaxID=97359 RepID=A0A550CZZ8_9AGAR|nr:hypothetical protein BD626DRAFT_564000 [Auriculariopsis ampla]
MTKQRTKKSTKISAAAPAQAPVPLKRSARIAAAQKSSRSQATRAPLVPVPSASNGNSTTAPAPTAPSTIAPKRMLTEAERKVILQASPAVYEFTKAGVRCAYCRTVIKLPTDGRNKAYSLCPLKKHLRSPKNHESKTCAMQGAPDGTLSIPGLAYAAPSAADKVLPLLDQHDEYLPGGAKHQVDAQSQRYAADVLLSIQRQSVIFAPA